MQLRECLNVFVRSTCSIGHINILRSTSMQIKGAVFVVKLKNTAGSIWAKGVGEDMHTMESIVGEV